MKEITMLALGLIFILVSCTAVLTEIWLEDKNSNYDYKIKLERNNIVNVYDQNNEFIFTTHIDSLGIKLKY